MKALVLLFVSALCLVLCPAISHAQGATDAEDWTEVVVKGRAIKAPAMWRVTKGDAQVIILGTLPVFPKKQAWNTKRIENALRGANLLITPAGSHIGAGDAASLMLRKGLPSGQTLEEAMPADLYARYDATARRAGVSIRNFAKDKPVWAGVRLRREVLEKRGISDDEPVGTVKRLARRAGVPIRAAGNYDMGRIVKDVNAMPDQAAHVCFAQTLDDIAFMMDRLDTAARAWSVGDIATVRSHYQGSSMARCLSGSGKGAALLERSVADTVSAVDKALMRPGKTVAVFPLAVLLRRGAALDRLRAKGYDVSSPE